MKKIFSKEIFLSPLFLILSFFLFSFNVSADTITLTPSNITSDINTYLNSDFYSFKTLLENDTTCSQFSNFVIYYYDNHYYSYCSNYAIGWYTNSTSIYFYPPVDTSPQYYYSQNSLISISSRPVSTLTFYTFSSNIMNYSVYLYAKNNINACSNSSCRNHVYSFSYLNNSIEISYNNAFYSLYDLSQLQPSTPSDNTPILTNFYTLIIDKFSIIADFFADNTYLFALPLIPIFILCIYLIKRSLIK